MNVVSETGYSFGTDMQLMSKDLRGPDNHA